MKRKHFILALVAMLWSFSVSAETTVTTEADLRDALATGGEIKLGENIEVTNMIVVPAGVTATLDLNGCTITVPEADADGKHIYVIDNQGILTLKDDLGGGSIAARGIYNGYNGNAENAKLTIESGKYIGMDNGGAAIFNGAELVINGGEIHGYRCAVDNALETANTTIDGGTFGGFYKEIMSTSYIIRNDKGNLVINDADVISGFGAVGCYGGTTVINDGSFLPTGWAGYTCHVVYVAKDATVTIKGGTFKMNYPADAVPNSGSAVASYDNGTLTISGGSFTAHFDNVSPVELSAGSEITGGSYYNHAGEASTHSYVTNYVKDGYELGEDGTVESTEEVKPLSLDDFVTAVVAGNGTYDGNGITVSITPASGDARTTDDTNIPNRLQKYSNPEVYYAQYQRFSELTDISVSNVNFVFVPAAVTVLDAWNTSGATTTAENINGELQFMNGGSVTLTNCTFDKVAVSPINATAVNVSACAFSGLNAYAIKDIKASTVAVSGTTFTDCNGGFWMSNAPATLTVTDNEFTNVGRRGAMQFSANGDYSNTAMTVTGNKVTGGAFLWQLNTTVTYDQIAAILDSEKNTYETAYVAGSTEPVAPPTFDGEGTAASPYIIDGLDKLVALRDAVNGGEAYEGVYFKLTSDITLTGEWTPIGTGSRSGTTYTGNAFKGVFDGANNTISGLTITSSSDKNAAVGLFGVVDGGTVKNLTLDGVNINVANSNLAGAAIGMMLNGATADNITVNGAVTGNDGVGGIVGRLIIDGTIANCINNASVTSSYGGIGGIVGKAYYDDANNTSLFASIENCTNNGTITAPMYVGGIVGLARTNVTGCVNNGEVAGGTQTGGIVGQLMAAGTVSGNENKAKVSGKNHLGGIIGDYSQTTDYHFSSVSIANNINRGELAATEQCAAIMGCNNIDGFTGMTATGNVSYYYVEGLELFGNPEDMVIDATNKFVLPPVATIGSKEYTSLQEAINAAQAGETITLLSDVICNETPVFTNGGVVNIDINGHVFKSNDYNRVRNVVSADGAITSNNIKFVSGFGWEVYNAAGSTSVAGTEFHVFPTLAEATTYKPSGKDLAARIYIYEENVKLESDVTLQATNQGTASTICIDPGYTVTLDLNGYTVLQESPTGNPLEACIRGTFVLDDTSEAKSGKWIAGACGVTDTSNTNWYGNGGPAFYVLGDGLLTLKSGEISIARNTSKNSEGEDVVNGGGLIRLDAGALIVDGATLKCEDTYGIMVWGGAVTVNSGKFEMGENGAYSIFAMNYYTDASVEVNSAIDGYLLVHNSATAVVNVAGVRYVANGTDYVAPSVGEGLVAQGGLVDIPVAKINEAKYISLQEAINAAQAGETVTLLTDVTLAGGYDDAEEALRIEKAVTINGAGYTIDCGNLRKGIRVYNNGTGIAVVRFENVTIKNDAAQGRCIDTRTSNIALTLSNATLIAEGTNSQPLTIGGSTPAYSVTMLGTTINAGKSGYGVISFVPVQAGITTASNTVIEGLAAFYLKSDAGNTKLTLGHGTYTGTNLYSSASGSFGAVVVEGNNNTITMNINLATIKAVAGDGAAQAAFNVRGAGNTIQIAAEGAQVLTEGAQAYRAIVKSDVAASTKLIDNGTELSLVAESNGVQFYSFEEAVRFAGNEGTVKLVNDVVLENTWTVAAGQDITLDLNGKTISANIAEQLTKSFAAIQNRGTLTVKDETGNGKVTVSYGGASFGYGMGLYTISNEGGVLNIEGGTIENTTSVDGSMYDAIDNNSTLGNTILNISGGEVVCGQYIGIRQFANSTTHENTVNVTGGKVVGGNTSIWMQNPGSNQPKATIAISGADYENGNYPVIEGRLLAGESTGFTFVVTGGLFDTDVNAFCAADYATYNFGDGTWGVEPTVIDEITLVDGEFTEFTNQNDKVVGTLTYKRANVPTTWAAFYFPFEVPVSQLAEQGFEVAYINGVRRNDTDFDGELDKFVMEVIYIHGGETCDGSGKTLKANYPYFIRAKEEAQDLEIVLEGATLYAAKNATYDCTTFTEKFEITGNTSKVSINSTDDRLIYAVSTVGEWTNITKGATLKPFRFYMALTSRYGNEPIAPVATMSIAVRGEEREDGTTFIYDVEMDGEQTSDYIYDLQGRRVLEPQKGGLYIVNGKKVIF